MDFLNKRSLPLMTAISGMAAMFLTIAAYGGSDPSDVIKLEDPAYHKHEESIVIFNHRKHSEEYREKNSELFNSTCGECHHDKDNKPRVSLKQGDEVQNCIECHKKPGYINGKKAENLSPEKIREYQGNAMHDNCKGCHQKYNRKKRLKVKDPGYAPNTCKSCHSENKAA